MAQSYSGAGYGSHFPLHKGAEVVLAFIGGNPDRPIIVGAIPNAHTPSPTASKNATQSIMHTASGIRFVMDDKTSSASKTS
jgi:type VI secretion system secreted protein VgrG